MLSNLPDLAVSGVYSIEWNSLVYVGFSKNVLKAFAGHMEDIKQGRHNYIKCSDLGGLRYNLLETVEGTENIKLSYNKWCSEYRNTGWTLYRKYTPLKYKVRTRISADNKVEQSVDFGYLVVVELVNRRNETTVVGVFNKNEYAEEFIKKYYSGEINKVVISQNECTKKYRSFL